jgi:hypothetical protein
MRNYLRTALGGVLLLAVALLTGCSGQSSSGTTADPPKTADSITKALGAKVSTMRFTKTFNADDDPNHLLGRPNGYLSKTAFADTRVPADQVPEGETATERGGGVEVFADEAAAQARADDIQAKLKNLGGLLAQEYDYTKGPVLVRVSGLLTPEQAKEYETALATIG